MTLGLRAPLSKSGYLNWWDEMGVSSSPWWYPLDRWILDNILPWKIPKNRWELEEKNPMTQENPLCLPLMDFLNTVGHPRFVGHFQGWHHKPRAMFPNAGGVRRWGTGPSAQLRWVFQGKKHTPHMVCYLNIWSSNHCVCDSPSPNLVIKLKSGDCPSQNHWISLIILVF